MLVCSGMSAVEGKVEESRNWVGAASRKQREIDFVLVLAVLSYYYCATVSSSNREGPNSTGTGASHFRMWARHMHRAGTLEHVKARIRGIIDSGAQ